MKVCLEKDVSLCFTCANCTDDKCDWVKSGGKLLPEYVNKTKKRTIYPRGKKIGRTEDIINIRNCRKYVPEPECIIKCKYCGEEYVLQAQYNKNIDGGYCYDCHVARKETYYVPRENMRGIKPPNPKKEKKCPICNKLFVPEKSGTKYCSPKCREIGTSRALRKTAQAGRNRKADQKLKQKWDLDNETAKIEKKAENLIKTLNRQNRKNIKEVKDFYQKQHDEFFAEVKEKTKLFKEQWEEALSKALTALDEQYQKDMEAITVEKDELIKQAKENIMQPKHESEENKNGKN